MRQKTKQVMLGALPIGGGAPVAVQSMLNAPAANVQANVSQALRLQAAGCQIIRVSLPSLDDVRLVKAIKNAGNLPLVADIHFDHRIAIAALHEGVDKIRLNPGNIGGAAKVRRVAALCRAQGVPIRIGVNGGSLEKQLLAKHGGLTPAALVESAQSHIALLEAEGFTDIVVSIKTSNVPLTVAAYRLLAGVCSYPLHLGVTEAGTFEAGLVKNAMGIGALLLDGIGDTIRVSLTDEPEKEVKAGFSILRAAGFTLPGAEVISCPTCGRTNIPVAEIAAQVEEGLQGLKIPLKVAVMGCVVNGIGEGKEADIGIAGGKDSAVLFVRGKKLRSIKGNYVQQLLQEIKNTF